MYVVINNFLLQLVTLQNKKNTHRWINLNVKVYYIIIVLVFIVIISTYLKYEIQHLFLFKQ